MSKRSVKKKKIAQRRRTHSIDFVAKHMNTYNKATVEEDKKKASKAGKVKHKKQEIDNE